MAVLLKNFTSSQLRALRMCNITILWDLQNAFFCGRPQMLQECIARDARLEDRDLYLSRVR
eukprot:15442294-Alexandrium_andersonii.AAC.1